MPPNSTNTIVSLKDIITLLVASWGAILATYLFFWQHRPKIVVTTRVGIPMDRASRLQAEAGGKELPPKIFLEAANPRPTPVTVNGVGFILPTKEVYAILPKTTTSSVTFPHKLERGQSCSVFISPDEILDALRKKGMTGRAAIIGYYNDQLGHTYESEPFDLAIGSEIKETTTKQKRSRNLDQLLQWSGIVVLIAANTIIVWRFGWNQDVYGFEWPPVGLALGMEGAVINGFSKHFQKFFPLRSNLVAWALLFAGFLLQLFGIRYARLG